MNTESVSLSFRHLWARKAKILVFEIFEEIRCGIRNAGVPFQFDIQFAILGY
jgi:hypothetical protein